MYVQGLLPRWSVLCLFELLRRSGHCFANASDLHRCTLELAEVDTLEKDDPHDDKFQGVADKLKKFCTNAEHHYNGTKGAKARYSGILGVK